MNWQDRCQQIMRYTYAVVKTADKSYHTPLYTTSIQKLVYLSLVFSKQESLLRESYMAYHYGPYSDDVSYCLQVLTKKGYLRKEAYLYGTLYRVEKEAAVEEERIVNDFCKLLLEHLSNINDVTQLSELAKTHFLLRAYSNVPLEQLPRKARILGWQLPKEKIEHYMHILKDVGLN